jgi:tetraacyldisaccharide 4'-kinase
MTDTDIKKILSGEDKRLSFAILRLLLLPLSYLHAIGLFCYLLPYRTGLRKQTVLPVPVIVIGNLTSGGTGKTPTTIQVVKMLQGMGQKVVILSRGHGSKGEGVRVVSDGERVLLDATVAGDEPLLLANSLPGVPVLVCKDRRVSGSFAVQRFKPDVIVLDDALQFWQLHRDLNIILLDAKRPFDNGFLLPRGLLREPTSHLSRASLIVLTRAENEKDIEETKALCAKYAPHVPMITAQHTPVSWISGSYGNPIIRASVSPEGLKVPVTAFCGIASPEVFQKTLEDLGVDVQVFRAFPNHHAYTKEDVDELLALGGEGAVFVTTEKDATKLQRLWPKWFVLKALRIEVVFSDKVALQELLQKTSGATNNIGNNASRSSFR